MSVPELEALQRRIAMLRDELPPGAPIVPFASVRAHDRTEVENGLVLELGLLSNRHADPSLGDLRFGFTRVLTFRGQLEAEHLEEAALKEELGKIYHSGEGMALVSDDFDTFGFFALDEQADRLSVLVPTGRVGPSIDALNGALGIRCGTLEPFSMGKMAHEVRWLASTDAMVLLDDEAPPLGLLYVGGADLVEARARVRAARSYLLSLQHMN